MPPFDIAPPTTAIGAIAEALGPFATETTVVIGLSCLAAQILFALLFAKVLPHGPWTAEPGYTAHQAVCLPLMVYMAYTGCATWFGTVSYPSAESRVLALHMDGIYLAQVAFCELLFWDIPVGLAVASMREPVMLAHHFGMLAAAAGGVSLNSYYGKFFFGACELTSVFLVICDLFHPKHKAWAALAEASPTLSALNNAMRGIFVLCYMLLRAIYFPYIVLSGLVPDVLEILTRPITSRNGASDAALLAPGIIGVCMVGLQWYWGYLLVQQLRKMLSPMQEGESKSKKA